jgi:diadenosine tetraphosphate (Ap4A) HIT family hydrolase
MEARDCIEPIGATRAANQAMERRMSENNCVYCDRTSEVVVWSDADCRVLHVTDSKFPGFCRVVWNSHVREFSDLDEAARIHLMRVVATVENGLRDLLTPDKINLASFGNAVPHLHWHVIPRYRDDSHYPESIWGAPQREGVARGLPHDFEATMKHELDTAFA